MRYLPFKLVSFLSRLHFIRQSHNEHVFPLLQMKISFVNPLYVYLARGVYCIVLHVVSGNLYILH